MNDLLDKLSSYNLFSNLFPGVLFVELARVLHLVVVPDLGVLERLVAYYFVGMVISRVGSLALEPALRRIRVYPATDYAGFISAEADPKIAILLEQSNVYRSLAAGFLILLAWFSIGRLGLLRANWYSHGLVVLFELGAVVVLFVLAHRKQARFIASRIAHHKAIGKPENPNKK